MIVAETIVSVIIWNTYIDINIMYVYIYIHTYTFTPILIALFF